LSSRAHPLRFLSWIPTFWYFLFLLGPLLLIFFTSFATRGDYGGVQWIFNVDTYRQVFDPLYLTVFFRSIVLAFGTAIACFVIGFPIALVISTSRLHIRSALILVLAIPFLTNLVIRICALKSVTAYGGPLDILLSFLSVDHDPYGLSQNLALVAYGMVTSYLPLMIFPIYSALEKFDFNQVEAAVDLGASQMTIIFKIILPQLRQATVSGCLLVFIPAMGEFVIPDLLGGAKTMLTGNLISSQFLKTRDWPFGSAVAICLMMLMFLAIALFRRLEKAPRHG
jgi:spermidine/putrescine transport system permease protein